MKKTALIAVILAAALFLTLTAFSASDEYIAQSGRSEEEMRALFNAVLNRSPVFESFCLFGENAFDEEKALEILKNAYPSFAGIIKELDGADIPEEALSPEYEEGTAESRLYSTFRSDGKVFDAFCRVYAAEKSGEEADKAIEESCAGLIEAYKKAEETSLKLAAVINGKNKWITIVFAVAGTFGVIASVLLYSNFREHKETETVK